MLSRLHLRLWWTLVPVLCCAAEVQFLLITDLHLDPYYGREGGWQCNLQHPPPQGQPGCDSPPLLVNATLQRAKEVLPSPAFVMVLGDVVRHYADAMDKRPVDVMRDVMSQVHEAYPQFQVPASAPVSSTNERGGILGVLGNNDMPTDYFLNVTERPNRYLQEASQAWATVLFPDERDRFASQGGYWREVLPKVIVVVLNTVIYSVEHKPHSTADGDPLDQFAWMQSVLHRVRSRKATAYIIGHIAPTIADYQKRSMWHAGYVRRYVQLVMKYSDVIGGQLFGHFHSNHVRTFPRDWGLRSPLYVFQAVTPVFANMPAFHVVTLGAEHKSITAIATHSTTLTTPYHWALQQSNPHFLGMPNLTNAAWRGLAAELLTNDTLWRAYQFTVDGHDPTVALHTLSTPAARPSCQGKCRWDTVCLMLHFLPEDFKACQARFPGPPEEEETKKPLFLVVAIFVVVILLLLIVYLRCTSSGVPTSTYPVTDQAEGEGPTPAPTGFNPKNNPKSSPSSRTLRNEITGDEGFELVQNDSLRAAQKQPLNTAAASSSSSSESEDNCHSKGSY